MLQRGGEVVIRMLEDVKQVTIGPLIDCTIAKGSVVYTDEYDIYGRLDEWGYDHQRSAMPRASTPGTTTGMGSARSMSIRSKGSGRCCVRGSAPTGEFLRKVCRLYLGFFEFVHNVRCARQEAVGCADRPVVGTTLQSILSLAEIQVSRRLMETMAKLRPWYQVVTPREDLRENRPLDASEFAVHLDHIRDKRAHEDYVKPERFFERTYMTKSLLDLSAQVVRRLSGIKVETSAVFNMATQFGGGKTHSLTAQYHLARGGDAAKSWRGVDAILSRAQVKTIPKANVAVFVGTEFDVIDGRGGDGEPHRKTPWGEIAWQLGGEKSFAAVAKHDEQGIAPAGDVIRKMLPKEPSLILMDELLNYVNKARKTGLASQLYDFLQSLSEEARAQDHVVLCVSIPASELEMNPEDQRDYDSYKKLLDRVGKAISMSSDVEVTEIIRRRLFDWHGLSDDMQRTAAAYAEWATRARHRGQQPRGRRGR